MYLTKDGAKALAGTDSLETESSPDGDLRYYRVEPLDMTDAEYEALRRLEPPRKPVFHLSAVAVALWCVGIVPAVLRFRAGDTISGDTPDPLSAYPGTDGVFMREYTLSRWTAALQQFGTFLFYGTVVQLLTDLPRRNKR